MSLIILEPMEAKKLTPHEIDVAYAAYNKFVDNPIPQNIGPGLRAAAQLNANGLLSEEEAAAALSQVRGYVAERLGYAESIFASPPENRVGEEEVISAMIRAFRLIHPLGGTPTQEEEAAVVRLGLTHLLGRDFKVRVAHYPTHDNFR